MAVEGRHDLHHPRRAKEPTFSTLAIANRVSPTPLAAIHSTRDEYVPLAEVQRVLAAAKEPSRLWVVEAADTPSATTGRNSISGCSKRSPGSRSAASRQ